MNYLKTLLDLYRLKKNAHLSADRMRSRQDEKLRKLLRFTWENSTWYRRAFESVRRHFKWSGDCIVAAN